MKPKPTQPKPRPFTDVTFPALFPQEEVADHQVFMSFRNDSDAAEFRDWWSDQGALTFGEYLRTRREG